MVGVTQSGSGGASISAAAFEVDAKIAAAAFSEEDSDNLAKAGVLSSNPSEDHLGRPSNWIRYWQNVKQ
jgi:hypothetical protein